MNITVNVKQDWNGSEGARLRFPRVRRPGAARRWPLCEQPDAARPGQPSPRCRSPRAVTRRGHRGRNCRRRPLPPSFDPITESREATGTRNTRPVRWCSTSLERFSPAIRRMWTDSRVTRSRRTCNRQASTHPAARRALSPCGPFPGMPGQSDEWRSWNCWTTELNEAGDMIGVVSPTNGWGSASGCPSTRIRPAEPGAWPSILGRSGN